MLGYRAQSYESVLVLCSKTFISVFKFVLRISRGFVQESGTIGNFILDCYVGDGINEAK